MWTIAKPCHGRVQMQLKQRGLLTAILSNMGDSVLASVERQFAWIKGFDVLVWSYQLHMAKPDPAIYLHTLQSSARDPMRRSSSMTSESMSTPPSRSA